MQERAPISCAVTMASDAFPGKRPGLQNLQNSIAGPDSCTHCTPCGNEERKKKIFFVRETLRLVEVHTTPCTERCKF